MKPCVLGPWQSHALSDLYFTTAKCPFATGGPKGELVSLAQREQRCLCLTTEIEGLGKNPL